ncbi:MAG: LysM peptidoglycan-binding domain-containing protein [Leptolinea sp.]
MHKSPPIRYNEIMFRRFLLISILGVTLAGCQDQPGLSASTSAALTPYVTRTSIVPSTIQPPPTLAPPAITPLPTQITHTVSKGEDLGGIATRYAVKIKDLRAANPEIDPRMIPVGTVLIIPSGNPQQDINQPTAIPIPAVTLKTGAPACYPDAAGGAWCLMDVENNSGLAVEDISADFVLSGSDNTAPQSRSAFGLLNRLPDKSTFPLVVYFPSAPAQPWQINTRLRTAFPMVKENERYLQNNLENAISNISRDAQSAEVSGMIVLQADQMDANIIWVAAAVYNVAGQPVGVRRWESLVGLKSGSGLTYDLRVYSLDGPIQRVEVQAETRP